MGINIYFTLLIIIALICLTVIKKINKNNILFYFIYTFFVIIIILLIAEILFRFVVIRTDSFLYSLRSQKFTKLYYKERNVNDISEKRRNIIILGDSFVYGYGIKNRENTLPYMLQKKLQKYNIVSYAQNALSIKHYISILKKINGNFDIEYVILGYGLNDIGDDLAMSYIIDNIKPHHKLKKILTDNSFFFNSLYYIYTLKKDTIMSIYINNVMRKYLNDSIFDFHKSCLLNVKQLVENSLNAKLLIIIYPYIGMEDNDIYKKALKRVKQCFEQNGINYIDLSEEFEGYNPKQLIVNKFDKHPSVFANSIVVNRILDIIE